MFKLATTFAAVITGTQALDVYFNSIDDTDDDVKHFSRSLLAYKLPGFSDHYSRRP